MGTISSFYKTLAKKIHEDNVAMGWWDDPDECIFQKLQLVSTEIAEATEGARKNLMDTHLKNRKMEEVEYADAMIRILDIGGKLDLVYYDIDPHNYCLPTNSVGYQQLGINAAIVRMAKSLREYLHNPEVEVLKTVLNHDYSTVIKSIARVAGNRSCEIFDATEEKLIYNAQRSDHKRENREQANGKKF